MAESNQAITPLPGMRDLLPPESHARRKVSEQLQGVFESYGYDLITTPLFERVEVFERGLTLDPRDLLRFVEPDGGEVAALRPDITPQIARVVSTRLTDFPLPFRLRYEGTVIRRRRGRARRQRQIAQVGIELLGIRGAEADVEVIRLTADALQAAGLQDFRIELSDVGVARALIPQELLEIATEPLARKDQTELAKVLEGVPHLERIAALAQLHGGLEVIDEAESLVRDTAAAAHVANLREVAQRLSALGYGPRLGVDLGEIRGAAYYTGVSFGVFARGPGEALASGGRYDTLLAQYGAPLPATGAGIDIENLLAALDAAGLHWRRRDTPRFVIAGADAESVASQIRAHGVIASTLTTRDAIQAREYARAWTYDAALLTDGTLTAVRTHDGASQALSKLDLDALIHWARFIP
ncbi:MAG TPA: ATP phosphoribosyltransferase regulatory subunit [Polyangiales bacterium]|nr:ATP phosphoribosyltransferase regulatory subunit [Polyangiales bacterium]